MRASDASTSLDSKAATQGFSGRDPNMKAQLGLGWLSASCRETNRIVLTMYKTLVWLVLYSIIRWIKQFGKEASLKCSNM